MEGRPVAQITGSTAPPQRMFIDLYKDAEHKVPWDVEGAQPGVVKALERGLFSEEVADLGCGLGNNAIFLGTKGIKVTAVDFSAEALKQAKERLAKAGPPATENVAFFEGSVLELEKVLGQRKFYTVLDSAVLHCFSDDDQKKYISSLTPLVVTGGKLLLLVFSDENKGPWKGPTRLSKEHLHSLFNSSTGWKIEEIESTRFNSLIHGPNEPAGEGWAYFSVVTKL